MRLLSVAALLALAALTPTREPPASVALTGAPPQGAPLAEELGCAACHVGVGSTATIRRRAPALGPGAPALAVDFVFAYLADPVRRRDDIGASRMADFRLDAGERLALALYLGGGGAEGAEVARARSQHPRSDAALGGRIFRTLGCAGCHAHPEAEPSPVGPDLSREGARARPEWLRAYLRSPSAIRSAAHPGGPGSRMPDFRLTDPEADALTAYLTGLGEPWADPPPELTPFQAERTERLLEGRLACLGCHRVDGVGGGIGPSLEGIGERLLPSFVVEMIRDPARAHPGALMPRQRFPGQEAERVARLLLDRSGPWVAVPPRSLADPSHPAWAMAQHDRPSEGAALYARHCSSCHGPGGGGDGWNASALPVQPSVHADAAAMSLRPDDTLFDGIHAGAFVLDGSARMPPFGELLRPDQIRALVAHIRTLCECEQPAWAGRR